MTWASPEPRLQTTNESVFVAPGEMIQLSNYFRQPSWDTAAKCGVSKLRRGHVRFCLKATRQVQWGCVQKRNGRYLCWSLVPAQARVCGSSTSCPGTSRSGSPPGLSPVYLHTKQSIIINQPQCHKTILKEQSSVYMSHVNTLRQQHKEVQSNRFIFVRQQVRGKTTITKKTAFRVSFVSDVLPICMILRLFIHL